VSKPDWAFKAAEALCHADFFNTVGDAHHKAKCGQVADIIREHAWNAILRQLANIKGGYVYSGVCSYQVCFPLKAGGELRFMQTDDDVSEGEPYGIDLYDGSLPPCITGPSKKTGQDDEPNDQQTDL
jgi:hypothetical protein